MRDSRWPLLALGVAGWMRYVSGTDDAGQTIDVRDPLVDKIRQRVAQSYEQQRVDALLGLEEIFGGDLPHNAQFVAGILRRLATAGDARRPRGRRPRAELVHILRLCGRILFVRLRTSLFVRIGVTVTTLHLSWGKE